MKGRTYVIWSEAFVGLHCDLAEVRIDLVALEGGHSLFSLVVHGDHDVGIGEQGQLHGFLEKATLSLVEAHLRSQRESS